MPFSKFLFLGCFSPHPPPRSFSPFPLYSQLQNKKFLSPLVPRQPSGDAAVGGTPPSPSAPAFCLPGAAASQERWERDALNCCARPASRALSGKSSRGVKPNCTAHSRLECCPLSSPQVDSELVAFGAGPGGHRVFSRVGSGRTQLRLGCSCSCRRGWSSSREGALQTCEKKKSYCPYVS